MGKQVTNGQSITSTQVTTRSYVSGRLTNQTIYTNDTRTVKVSDIINTYVGSKLVTTVSTIYGSDGITPVSVDTINYFEDAIAGGNKSIEKRS
jgi:hypothetical protein